jgi:DnaK suppressor protein
MADNTLMKAKTTRMPMHMAELGSENFDQELTLSLLGSERNALNQIEAAIKRVEEGSYGRCDRCSVRIPKARLQALPYAAQCVRCASKQEESHGS